MTRRHWIALLALALGIVGAACSSESSGPSSSPPPTAAASVPSDGEPPRVDLIKPAIAALEAQLGLPQQYFEINATSHLVNLFVALNDGTLVQNWLYFDGELTSKPAQPAQGHAFSGAAVTFDPDTVLSQIEHDLPDTTIDLFLIEGGANGAVRYTAIVTSSQGGQLEIVVGPDGTVQAVDTDTDTEPPTSTG